MTHAFVRPAQPGRRRLLAGAGAAVLAVFGRRALAQSGYPSQAITVTVPYAPGGQGDVFARLLGERLGAALGQTMVVENRPGASGSIGARQVARAAPDGYHLLLGQTGEMAVNPFVMPDLGYDPQRDFAAVALVGDSPLVLAVPAGSPHADLAALIAAARARPDTGTYAAAGTATPGHLAAAALARATGARMVHVPYKGAGQGMTELPGGRGDGFFCGAAAGVRGVAGGRLGGPGVATARSW